MSFHVDGPTAEKAQPCVLEVRANGTASSPRYREDFSWQPHLRYSVTKHPHKG